MVPRKSALLLALVRKYRVVTIPRALRERSPEDEELGEGKKLSQGSIAVFVVVVVVVVVAVEKCRAIHSANSVRISQLAFHLYDDTMSNRLAERALSLRSPIRRLVYSDVYLYQR